MPQLCKHKLFAQVEDKKDIAMLELDGKDTSFLQHRCNKPVFFATILQKKVLATHSNKNIEPLLKYKIIINE